MSFYIFKVIFTGCLIVLITEVAKVSGKLGGIITAILNRKNYRENEIN